MTKRWRLLPAFCSALVTTTSLATAVVCVAFVHGAAAQQNVSGATESQGRAIFLAQCSACHALTAEHNGRGPTLYHLFGRRSGTVPGYAYSRAMKSASIAWRDDTLARFITDPQRVVPGSTMTYALSSADRINMKGLIDFLRNGTR
jgi:cytochrome c2